MNNLKIEDIASKVLGKTSDGNTMMRYETPTYIDKSLLVGIPRYLNREMYNIEENKLPFVGSDVWNAYEFSCLTYNGFPLSGWLKFTYPSDSINIVESKSVKLYLNSFNMTKIVKTLADIQDIEKLISEDLSSVVESKVEVKLSIKDINTVVPIKGSFIPLEENCDVINIDFNNYNENPAILKVINTENENVYFWRTHSLRSNCRVTNQPDYGDVYVYIKSNKTVTTESLLQYIVSMRKENHFHEEIAECIYKRLHDLLLPDELLVACLYTRRGGIDINPVRASSQSVLKKYAPIIDVNNFCTKTLRQ